MRTVDRRHPHDRATGKAITATSPNAIAHSVRVTNSRTSKAASMGRSFGSRRRYRSYARRPGSVGLAR
ncbi:hypothetical protein, partial [Streptomyces acidiscabies]|uniref:hypothetical protein n=1 Tax=Streptomyces acidiscabies TaxID=42234 RepID=UPI000AE89B3B